MALKSPPSSVLIQQDDFHREKLIREIDGHAKEIEILDKRINILEEKFGNNEKIATTLSDTAANAVKMQTMLSDTFIKLLKLDESIKNSIYEIIDKSDRNYLVMALKRFGYLAWTFIVSAVSLIGGWLLNTHITFH